MAELHPLEVVKLDALVEALSKDVPDVAARIHKLLAASIFPDAQSGPAMVAELLRQNPDAGQRFCRLLFTGQGASCRTMAISLAAFVPCDCRRLRSIVQRADWHEKLAGSARPPHQQP